MRHASADDGIMRPWDIHGPHSAPKRSTVELRQWKPIETAPKDGTPVLCTGDPDHPGRVAIATLEHYGWRWDVDDTSSMFGEPTHWLPLPVASHAPSGTHSGSISIALKDGERIVIEASSPERLKALTAVIERALESLSD